MSHHDIADQLNDYVDCSLTTESRLEIEAHLETCDGCRDELARLRALLAEAAQLPESLEPPRDLWPGVAAELDGRESRSRSLWSPRYVLAAAALVFIVLSAALAVFVASGPWNRATADRTVAVVPEPGLLLGFQQAEAVYTRAFADLEEALIVAKGRLAPGTVALVERSLRIIDAAIDESRAALTADPANRAVFEALASRYRNRLHVLQQVTRLSVKRLAE